MAEAKSDAFDEIDDLCIRSIGVLAANMVEKANSGHPGAPMGMAAMAHVLWSKVMNGNSGNSAWANRDRFVLSNGHACALQYSMLHLTGYQVAMEDLKAFRQLNSKTPGHPENFLTDGVEVSTGPLGQGVAQAVGMAIASKYAQSLFGAELFNSTIYTLCGDGCLQEGVSAEAASLAGHLQLDNLVLLYDDNDIQIDGSTALAFTEDVGKRFAAYNWNVVHVVKGNEDLQSILDAVRAAQQTQDLPTTICVKTAIDFGSIRQSSHKVHGAPLGDECMTTRARWASRTPPPSASTSRCTRATRTPSDSAGARRRRRGTRRAAEAFPAKSPEQAKTLQRMLDGQLPESWEASRNMNGAVINALAKAIPELIGGAADMTPSIKTQIACSHDLKCLYCSKLAMRTVLCLLCVRRFTASSSTS